MQYTFLLVLTTKRVIPTVFVMLNLTYLISLYFKIKHFCFIVRYVYVCVTHLNDVNLVSYYVTYFFFLFFVFCYYW